MRIGLVLAAAPPYSETFIRNKISFLKHYGYDVVLFVDSYKEPFDDCLVYKSYFGNNKSMLSVLKAIYKLLFNFKQSFRLYQANNKDGFTTKQNAISLLTSAHILGHRLTWLHFGFATISINRENTAYAVGAKMAVSVRGSDLHVYPIFHHNCYNLLWQKIDRLHYISNYMLKLAQKQGFIASKTNAKLIMPAINTDFFVAPSERIINNKLVICTVARLHWIKGLEYVLESLSILKAKGIDFEYHLIGDGDEYNRLYFAAHQLGILPHIHFHGKQSQQVINKQLSNSDLFIMYSLDEGFCNSVLEAQLMGCLTLVSDNEALKENVIDEVTGWVVEGRNPKALANAIIRIIELDNIKKQKIKSAAINRVLTDFNLKKQLSAFVDFYDVNVG